MVRKNRKKRKSKGEGKAFEVSHAARNIIKYREISSARAEQIYHTGIIVQRQITACPKFARFTAPGGRIRDGT